MPAARPLIYLDNGATSWPKPESVGRAMVDFLAHRAGNPGRGGHFLAREASAVVEQARHAIAGLVHAACDRRIVLTHGCTDSVNMAIHGVIRAFQRQNPLPRDGECVRPHVVTTAIEHNAVLRTLHCSASQRQIDLDVIPCDATGLVSADAVARQMRPETLLLAISHSSNVLGTIQPVREIVSRARQIHPDLLVLLDAAQTVGHIPVDVGLLDVDLVSIAGHKALRGPTGTGALYVGPRAFPEIGGNVRIFCERRGGTGAVAPGLEMPNVLPDALEAGTPNGVGFAGLLAAMQEFSGAKAEAAHRREMELTGQILAGLSRIAEVTVYGLPTVQGRTPVVLFNIHGHPPRQVAARLDAEYGIAVRGGVHCAPMVHQTIGTGASGGVRVSPGACNTGDEIGTFLRAVRETARLPAPQSGDVPPAGSDAVSSGRQGTGVG